MRRLETNERFTWAVVAVLAIGWGIAIIAFFGWRGFGATGGQSVFAPYGVLLFTGVLVIAAMAIAWVLYSFGTAELRQRAELERRHRKGLEEVYRGTLQALTSALDMRDGETYGHSRRVMGYSLAIGRRLGLSATQLRTLAWGSLLHDLGKIGIRDEILLKPGPLTPEERGQMNEHVVIGYQMVQNIAFLTRASTIVRHHHERYDGNGYPDRMVGDEIPLLARIFSAADALDAMTSSRPYRKTPMDLDQARKLIAAEAGKQFCPTVVKHLMQIPRMELNEVRAASFLPLDDFGDLVRADEAQGTHAINYYRDVVTGTQNRAAWEAKKSQMTLVHGESLGTLIFLDVNDLKQVNDARGHLVGDRLLADLGARLGQVTQETYRIGGDEFVMWFPQGDWDAATRQLLTDVLGNFATYWHHVLPTVSVSWGVSAATEETTSLIQLCEEADRAMYQQKSSQREVVSHGAD